MRGQIWTWFCRKNTLLWTGNLLEEILNGAEFLPLAANVGKKLTRQIDFYDMRDDCVTESCENLHKTFMKSLIDL